MNRFYGISSLKEKENYQVCSNIAQQLKKYVVPSCTKRKRDDVVDGTTITLLSKRVRGIDVTLPSVYSLKNWLSNTVTKK